MSLNFINDRKTGHQWLRRITMPALLAVCMAAGTSAFGRVLPVDPLESVMWKSMAERFMPEGEIVFDDRVKVMAPLSAENQFHVPVTVDASALDDVKEIIVVADLNPIPLVMEMQPTQALSYICLLYTSPSPRDRTRSRMPSSA